MLTKLIDSVTKLAGITKANIDIAEAGTAQAAAATPSDIADVNTVMKGLKK
ncbi:Variable major protein (plasmid) [Borrelia nietonii YOR]|uniref:Variable major protein n=1 Tax=Borrelia nietonii YOR TaxID=1293576 RepID=W5SC38_9SPIR|nr:Variable major protein [Borrelia nietonii YOR]